MTPSDKPIDDLLSALKERAKELNCLYEVEELFSKPDATLPEILQGMVRVIPPGWQFPEVCQVKIVLNDLVIQSDHWKDTPWVQRSDVLVDNQVVGSITVSYSQSMPEADEGPFLKEERKLLETIVDRLERRIFHERMKTVFEGQKQDLEQRSQWMTILELLRKTDARLLMRITRKMLNYLSWSGIQEVKEFLPGQESWIGKTQNENKPLPASTSSEAGATSQKIFEIAVRYLGETPVLTTIQEWIIEDRSNFVMKTLEDSRTSLAEIIVATERLQHSAGKETELSPSREKAFRVSLIRRLLNDDPQYMKIAATVVDVADFHELWRNVIFPAGSHGKVGGKGSGLFLADRILRKSSGTSENLQKIRFPKTWYLTSDSILHFINHNDLEEILEQKYESLSQIRQEYPYIVHVFKNSRLPQDIINGLSAALDDFGESPLVVRSSSLLEDRLGASFAGKYKSLFIPNQGNKSERLRSLMDAITEVFASTFNPDAIEYRAEHGMIDFPEEMGILIQEVIGRRVGDYFLPAFAGVAFSSNEFRWSQKIRKEDGLLRMVPGLGTRAVDRLSDDYPILLSPGQPNVSVNVSLEEKIWYSPKKVDVVNLKTGSFETIEFSRLFRLFGKDYPLASKIVSLLGKDGLRRPGSSQLDFEKDQFVVTFDGLFHETDFLSQIRSVLETLQREMNGPVDIEFAHNGDSLYLLQCRYQSHSKESHPVAVPRSVDPEKALFTARRYISTGAVTGITHLVYVDPIAYGDLKSTDDFLAVGRAIGKLNQILPKRQFVLLGPGRWGSRGDIRLGVSVTYSDIKNTAMLIEIAKKRRGFMPELSFGTHFFQDLVESSIRYLPLYPDDEGVIFNESFFLNSLNIFTQLAPEFSRLGDVIRVIDIPQTMPSHSLQVLMDGQRNEAVGVLTDSPVEVSLKPSTVLEDVPGPKDESHWRWRMKRMEQLARHLQPERFGIHQVYVFGSTKNATAGPKSDIDLLIHFQGSDEQRKELMAWLEGWSLCLSEENYLRTGHRTSALLDVHIVTDEDIRNRTSYASKIGSIADPPLPLKAGK